MVLALVGLGCRPDPQATEQPEPAAEPTVRVPDHVPVRPPTPAFVILGSEKTTVIPVDAQRPVIEHPGMFVGGIEDPGLAHGRLWEQYMFPDMLEEEHAGAPLIPVCPSGDYDDPCLADPEEDPEGVSRQLAIDLRRTAEGVVIDSPPSCPCVVVAGISTDDEPEPEFDIEDPEMLEVIEMSPYSPEEYEDHCSDEALAENNEIMPTSYMAGVLYETGMTHNGVCSGLNLYDGGENQVILRPGAKPISRAADDGMQCLVDGPGDMLGYFFDEPPPFEGECELGLDCDNCNEPDEMTAFAIRHGQLGFAAGEIQAVGGGCGCMAWEPITPQTCPSPLDPCGDPGPFGDLDDYHEHWIATDGQAALVMDDEHTLVLLPKVAQAVRAEAKIDDILGVEFHPDTILLEPLGRSPVYRIDMPEVDPEDETYLPKTLGNRCYKLFKKGKLEQARAACFAGLQNGGPDGTRGAIAYNLGRIEEERGNKELARGWYERSLALRPNETVEKRLKGL